MKIQVTIIFWFTFFGVLGAFNPFNYYIFLYNFFWYIFLCSFFYEHDLLKFCSVAPGAFLNKKCLKLKIKFLNFSEFCNKISNLENF